MSGSLIHRTVFDAAVNCLCDPPRLRRRMPAHVSNTPAMASPPDVLLLYSCAGQRHGRAAGRQLQSSVSIDRQALVDLTQALVRIRSDYSEGKVANHDEIAAFLAKELRDLGMTVSVLEPTPHYPIVVGRLKGRTGRPVLGTMGHYNTVPPGDRARWTVDPLGAEIRDGRIYGLGANDQKGGIASLIVATRAIIRSGMQLDGDLVHLYLPGEGAQDHVLPIVVDRNRDLVKTDWYLDTDGGRDIMGVAAGHIWLETDREGQVGAPRW